NEQVEAAALERLGQLARIVRGQHDRRNLLGAHGAQLGHAHLEVREHLEQERFELRVGAVNFVNEQEHIVLGGDGLQQRARQQEALREKDVLFLCDAVGGLCERVGAAEHVVQLVAQQ